MAISPKLSSILAISIVTVLLIWLSSNPHVLSIATFSTPPSSERTTDWFNKTKWKEFHYITHQAPYWENICIYNEQFWVTSREEMFLLQPKSEKALFGGGYVPNGDQTRSRIVRLLNSHVWPAHWDKNQKCSYDPVTNHFILHSPMASMAFEFYTRVIFGLYELINIQNRSLIGRDTQMHLTTHNVLAQPFTKYPLRYFSRIFESTRCICYKTKILSPMWVLAKLPSHHDYDPKLINLYNTWMYTIAGVI